MQVAIDGPAGSGKSSVCKIIAKNILLHILILVQCIEA